MQNLALYAKVFSVFSKELFILINGLCESGVILKELEQNSNFSIKSEVLTRGGGNPLIYVIKIYGYRSSLRKLICKLRLFITNKKIRKKIGSSSGLFK